MELFYFLDFEISVLEICFKCRADWKAIFPRITLIPNGIAIFKAMEFNLRCSESMPDFSRVGMMNEDIPNVPRRGPSPPRGFFRSQI
ncbi:hypothetical protein AtNW77_Chr5g0121771 [Arabidopsis thaliana]